MTYCTQCGVKLVQDDVDGRSRPKCPECGWVYWEDPKVVVALLIERTGRVLLGRRGYGEARGLWSFPAGFVDRGEQLQAAARREAQEEAGLLVDVGRLFAVWSEEGNPVVLVVYQAHAPHGSPRPSVEMTEWAWFDRADERPALAFPHDDAVLDAWWEQGGDICGR